MSNNLLFLVLFGTIDHVMMTTASQDCYSVAGTVPNSTHLTHSTSPNNLLGVLFFFFLSFVFSGPHLRHMEFTSPIGATAASLRHSHSNAGSELCL